MNPVSYPNDDEDISEIRNNPPAATTGKKKGGRPSKASKVAASDETTDVGVNNNQDMDFWKRRTLSYMRNRKRPESFPTAAEAVVEMNMVSDNPSTMEMKSAIHKLGSILRQVRAENEDYFVCTQYNAKRRTWTLMQLDNTNDNIGWMRYYMRRRVKTLKSWRKLIETDILRMRYYSQNHPEEKAQVDSIILEAVGEANERIRVTMRPVGLPGTGR